MSTPGEPVPQRIGDAERDRAVELLRDHMAEGRLDQAEFDERLTAALSARTAGDLDPLFRDLPGPRPGTSVMPAGTQAPPWQAQHGLTPAAQPSAAVVPADKKWNTALVIASGIAWPATLLVLFATSWHYWWLIFIPIMISSIAGNNRHHRGHNRDRDRDRRRGIDS